jgi:NitT/TauT family transport system substrate-binding protein
VKAARRFAGAGMVVVALLAAGCGSDGSGGSGASGKTGSSKSSRPSLKLSVNPTVISYLPFFVAIDRGYFDAAGVDVKVIRYQQSGNTQIPLLARGDIDVTTTVPGPALFNQFTGGFDLKIIGAATQAKPGYLDDVTMVVGSDSVNEIKTPKDLRGKKVDGAVEGSPVHFFTAALLKQGGLTQDDVTMSFRGKTLADQQLSLKNKAVDVQGSVEPAGTIMEGQGIGRRWLSYRDVIPGYQSTFIAASERAIAEKSDALQRFMRGYLRAVDDLAKAGPHWTPELVDTAVKWTGAPAKLIRATGAPPFAPRDGAVDMSWLEKDEAFWLQEKLVKKRVDVNDIVASGPLNAARAAAR